MPSRLLVIPGERPLSYNKTLKRNYHVYTANKQIVFDLVATYCRLQNLTPVPDEWYPLLISFLYFFDKRPLDVANCPNKEYEDALRNAGIIRNDGFKDVRAHTTNTFLDAKNPRVEILIEPVGKINCQ